MRKFKTSEKNRTNYIYRTASGKEFKLEPKLDGVNEAWITLLHDWDDVEVDNNRRENYKCPVHYQAYVDDNDESASDRNEYLADSLLDPLEQMLASINEQEHTEKLHKLKTAITSLTELQQDIIYKKFYLGMTNVAIAKEAGVSEAAIRKRLKNIYEQLKKKL